MLREKVGGECDMVRAWRGNVRRREEVGGWLARLTPDIYPRLLLKVRFPKE